MRQENGIVKLLIRDKQDGFRALLSAYKEQVYWHIRRITINHEDAQDATQEAFIRIYKALDRFDAKQSLTAWLYKIATNEALRLVSKRHPEISMDAESEQASDGTYIFNLLADQYVDYENKAGVALQKAILMLPYKQRISFNLRYFDQLSFEQIAQITDTTPTGARVNWHKAQSKVKHYIKESYE